MEIMSETSKIGVRRVTRRDLGVALASITAMEACRRSPRQKYTGALNGFNDKVDTAAFNPMLHTRKLQESAPLRMTFRAKTRAEAEQWQRSLRAKVLELVGGFPEKRSPLQPQTLEVRDFPGYRREKFVFQSRPDLTVLGYLLAPKDAEPPYAPVIALPGHGRGVDDLVGIDRMGRDRTVKVDYQYDYAVQVVEHGMAAVAIEPIGFGCRRDPRERDGPARNGLDQFACYPWASAALLFGQTTMGWRVYDVSRTIDWIETRKELDPARVGCMGISNGGECTIWAAAIETRIRAAFASGSLNTFRDSIMSYIHCIDCYVPGILNWAEMYDVAGLTAPRAFFAESGEKDVIFPTSGSRASFERVKRIYEVFGAGALAEQEVFDGPHRFRGKRDLPFLAQHLGSWHLCGPGLSSGSREFESLLAQLRMAFDDHRPPQAVALLGVAAVGSGSQRRLEFVKLPALSHQDSVRGGRDLVLSRPQGKCTGNSRGIKDMRAEPVFHGAHRKSNKFKAFPSELVSREVGSKERANAGVPAAVRAARYCMGWLAAYSAFPVRHLA